MKRSIWMAAVLATAPLLPPVVAAESPLRMPMSECLDPARARSFHLLDSDELLVDAGRRRFHVQLSFACPELNYNHEIVFRPGPGIGRLCGLAGDHILFARRAPSRTVCGIAAVTPIEREQWDAYLAGGGPAGSVTVRD
jgi:hypothetical protein